MALQTLRSKKKKEIDLSGIIRGRWVGWNKIKCTKYVGWWPVDRGLILFLFLFFITIKIMNIIYRVGQKVNFNKIAFAFSRNADPYYILGV